jgi:hypothetical protein
MNYFEAKLWRNYLEITPSLEKIKEVLSLEDNKLFNDHIAFRSLNCDGFGIERLCNPLYNMGYEVKNEYHFKAKKLKAVHLENKFNPERPKIFISELLLNEFSPFLRHALHHSICQKEIKASELYTVGRKWPVNHGVYQRLLQESEYAAWLYVHGYRVNHFTLNINALRNFSIELLCFKLKQAGFELNDAGTLIKGNEVSGLKQASTMADSIMVKFDDIKTPVRIPSCYVEFAERFKVKGQLFNGFLVNSADKIFESTNLNSAA